MADDFACVDWIRSRVPKVTSRFEGESCVELRLTDPNSLFYGLIRHFSPVEKAEILDRVCQLRNLKVLDLKKNRLGALPAEMGFLTGLEHLNLSSNCLGVAPEWLSRLRQLRYLNLGMNDLRELPVGICEMENLEVLRLLKNRIETLSESFHVVKKLKTLDLYMNKIARIPDFIFSLTEMEYFSIFRFVHFVIRVCAGPEHDCRTRGCRKIEMAGDKIRMNVGLEDILYLRAARCRHLDILIRFTNRIDNSRFALGLDIICGLGQTIGVELLDVHKVRNAKISNIIPSGAAWAIIRRIFAADVR